MDSRGGNDIKVGFPATGGYRLRPSDYLYAATLISLTTGTLLDPLCPVVRLQAEPGLELADVDFLAGALSLANSESGTTAWFALKFGSSTFGVFDSFADEAGRQAHLHGPIAAALTSNAGALPSAPTNIDKIDLLASKLRGRKVMSAAPLLPSQAASRGAAVQLPSNPGGDSAIKVIT